MKNIFQMPYEIAYYDTDMTGKMTLEAMIRVAILVSEKQSTALFRDARYLKPLNLGWVITQYDLEVTRYPKTFEKLVFYTQATSWNKFFCYRDFWLQDEAGTRIATIHSTFVLMDLTSRKIKTVTEEIIAPFGGVKENKIYRGEKLPPLMNASGQDYRVRYFDLDGNQHVNNAKYFNWLLDPLEKDFLKGHEVKKAYVRFDKEVMYGESIISQHEFLEENVTLHQIKTAGNLCAEAKIWWQEI